MSSSGEGGGCDECERLRKANKKLRKEVKILKKKLGSIQSYAKTCGWIRPNQEKKKSKKARQKNMTCRD